MEKRNDNIYIYVWEELNTIYIGRTINPKGRHYAHKHRKTESTYKFSEECGVEHPKMIIIENDLTIEEGAEREKYWIEYYKENNNYVLLNKSCGGQIGQQKTTLTKEEKTKRKREKYKKFYQKNKEEIKEHNKKYREENREKILAYKKKYREKHREELLNKQKEYNKLHREERLEYYKKYRETHKKN